MIGSTLEPALKIPVPAARLFWETFGDSWLLPDSARFNEAQRPSGQNKAGQRNGNGVPIAAKPRKPMAAHSDAGAEAIDARADRRLNPTGQYAAWKAKTRFRSQALQPTSR